MKTKPAICHKCSKDLKGRVPEDAEEVTCFRCSELMLRWDVRRFRRRRLYCMARMA